MALDSSIENLFKEHSLDEIETIRDNLASEIEKRTELLKSIVKEKYSDVVETSDAIQSMKLNLKEVEKLLWSFDKNISDFYRRLREPKIESSRVKKVEAGNPAEIGVASYAKLEKLNEADVVREVLNKISEIWDYFDQGDLKNSLRTLNESLHLLELNLDRNNETISSLKTTLKRAEEMIKNSLWQWIYNAAPDQIGIIAGSDEVNLYQMSFNSSMKFLVDNLREELSDLSYHAQIKRYQPLSIFNTQTNELEQDFDYSKTSSVGYVMIPRLISPELSFFLYRVCKVVNTIAGFNITRSSIVDSLGITIEHILEAYTHVVSLVESLEAETKRKRALQLYFDLLYIRILLNTSKNIDLIERLDPKIKELADKYEIMLDSIELYMISAALHSNVVNLSQSTIRLYGLLIPHLQ